MQKPIRIELPTKFAMDTVNAYLFTEPEITLVDCGEKSEESWEKLNLELKQHGLKIQDIQKIIITHAHVDHMGQAARLAAHSHAEVWVSDYVYEWAVNLAQNWAYRIDFLENITIQGGLSDGEQKMTRQGMEYILGHWDPIPAERIRTFSPTGNIQIGHQHWEVIYAPGHAITQTCFYEPESKQFLSADMLLYITPVAVIESPLDRSTERIPGLVQMLESYQKVAALDILDVYPGHREPFQGHRALIEHQVTRIHNRKEQCYDLIKAGHRTVKSIFEVLYKDTPPQFKIPGFAMAIGYLDLLLQEGRIANPLVDGVWQFEIL
ncbi:MAG: MBL fold metallo-hydrolase [Microscillaceae bacterium]|nr:MBL fold metallo-hydrolase [Microscillaceae bacterium]